MSQRPAALRAIILYKLVKAVAEAALGVAALWLLLRGAEAAAASLAEVLLESTTRAWAVRAATLLVLGATTAHVKLATVGAFADAALSAVEGLALRAGHWWAPWLVVGATGALLPWEVWELARRPGWARLAVLLLNALVVAYLLRRVVRERGDRAAIERALGGR